MGIADDYGDLLDALGLGPNDWKERLKGHIEFESPEGSKFKAKWRASSRTVAKKLGIFEYPLVKGSQVKDMDVMSNRYPLTFAFDGKDNDKTATLFFNTIPERGVWKVNHPIHGELELQPISFEIIDDPMESGGVTVINSEWIDPVDPDDEETASELQSLIDGLKEDLGLDAIEQFVDAVSTASETLSQILSLTAMAIENGTEKALSPLAALDDAVYNAQLDTQAALQQIYNATVLDTTALAANIQDSIRNPSLAASDIEARLDYYDDMQDELFDTLPGGLNSPLQASATGVQKKNSTLMAELGLNAATGARSQIAITGPLKTRSQAVQIAEEILDRFNTINSRLEDIQVDLEDLPIDEQYFANRAYASGSVLVSQTARYLLKAAFDLKVEKRFTLEKWRAPIEIAVTEYGELGINDEFYDLFIDSNDLQGDDLILLPPGREVVVYI